MGVVETLQDIPTFYPSKIKDLKKCHKYPKVKVRSFVLLSVAYDN